MTKADLVELIYEQVRQRIPSISLGTVYKNVKTFLDSGVLKEVTLHHGSLRLESNMTPHHHLVCSSCKAIFDIEESAVEPVRLPASKLPAVAIMEEAMTMPPALINFLRLERSNDSIFVRIPR